MKMANVRWHGKVGSNTLKGFVHEHGLIWPWQLASWRLLEPSTMRACFPPCACPIQYIIAHPIALDSGAAALVHFIPPQLISWTIHGLAAYGVP